ncbi:hypothetical protein EYR40_001196 [Pleurotus pulmonarius]|nr:hypothetical protein EYR36_000461 [Pleurotus pulmonarius]KAF4608843.1 hypothetical protein EYR40_001196 [Pleurotus pulmonarius]
MASTMPPYMLPGVQVAQPPHLDGDSSLATEILPGPPSITSVQQAALKRDTKKPVSYLPPLDPNSTYSALLAVTPAASIPQIDGPRPKRMRAERGGASGRAQRATARHQNGQTTITPIPSASNEGSSISALQAAPIDVDAAPISDDMLDTSASAPAKASTSKPSNGRGRPRKDKGKGKEASSSSVTVKEEPKTVVLNTPEPPVPMINNNEDHCFACRSTGALIYCDGCPRAFHFWCLDPPEENVDEGNSKWYCPACTAKQFPPQKPPPGLFSPLIQQLLHANPNEYQLPEDIRTFFKDVATAPNGAYVDSSETKQPRLNRHGQLDERDQHRLRDRNGVPVLCFRCGTSALPESVAAAAPAAKRARRSSSTNVSETWRPIVSCDYCSLHWHLDCLEPPLPIMPTFTKKWMCPNHSEHVIPLKRRIPKHNAPPIDITGPNQFNNGNIEVIQPETMPNNTQTKVAVDEVLINGRRYRVPERVIVLDFWNRINGTHGIQPQLSEEEDSGMSSPLTSLSSLEGDLDDIFPPLDSSHNADDLHAASLLMGFKAMTHLRPHRSPSKANPLVNGISKHPSRSKIDANKQTDAEDISGNHHARIISRNLSLSVPKPPRAVAANGMTRTITNESAVSTMSSAGPSTAPVKRRRKSTASIQPEPSARELRSRTKREDTATSTTTKGSSVIRSEAAPSARRTAPAKTMSASEYLVHAGVVPPREMRPPDIIPAPRIIIKLEDTDQTSLLLSGSPPKVKRRARKTVQKEQKEKEVDPSKEKRGRKRKQPEDEVEPDEPPSTSQRPQEKAPKTRRLASNKSEVDKPESDKPKTTITPKRPPTNSRAKVQAKAKAPTASSTTSTPTLKIRLPRMSTVNLSSPQRQGLNVDTPTCL